MCIRSLIQLLEIVQSLAKPERITIVGSSSLLPENSSLGEPGQPLEASYDADLLLMPIDDELAAILMESVGQQSLFTKRHGYYADILRPIMGETLPDGWESRLHPVAGYANVFALDIYDLALVKLMVGREKDLELLRALLRMNLIEPAKLQQHYQNCPMGEREAVVAGRNLTALLTAIGAS
jgi:hypothetical protein